MNANRSFRFLGLMALGLLAASLAPATASAHAFKAYFTLPVETVWGQVVMPPGTYSITLDSQAFPNLVEIEGKSVHFLVMPSVVDVGQTSDSSKLYLVRTEGRGRIRSLQLGSLGATYWYAPPRGERLIAQGPELIERLPITRSGK